MSLWTLVAILGFGALLILTAAVQPRRWKVRSWVRARDRFALVPWWTFFAPNPGVTDVRLLWREELVDGTVGPWHEAVRPRGGYQRAAWNPTKRARKGAYDCGRSVSREGERGQTGLALLSLPYLMILQHVLGLPASPLGRARQFVVVETQGADDQDGLFNLLFVSPWHPLTDKRSELRLGRSEVVEREEPAA
jgi:hypothetical protein